MKKILCILTALMFTLSMAAQMPRDGRMGRREFSPEEFEKRREEFIAKQAELTPEESAKFFPLLKEMEAEQRKIGAKQRKLQNPGKDLSEEDYKIIVSNMTNMELQYKKIEQTYYTKKFPNVLSWKKIFRVRMALERYKMEALRMFAPQNYGNGRNHQRDNNKRGPQCD